MLLDYPACSIVVILTNQEIFRTQFFLSATGFGEIFNKQASFQVQACPSATSKVAILNKFLLKKGQAIFIVKFQSSATGFCVILTKQEIFKSEIPSARGLGEILNQQASFRVQVGPSATSYSMISSVIVRFSIDKGRSLVFNYNFGLQLLCSATRK